MTDLQQSLSSLQVQDAQGAQITPTLPLSPPGDAQTPPLLTNQPPVLSPSQVLPTPPPSIENSPIASSKDINAEITTNDDTAGELMLHLLNCC